MQREVRYLILMPEYEMGGAETQFRYFIAYADAREWKLDVIIEQRFCRDSLLLKKDTQQMKCIRFYQLHEHGVEREKMLWHMTRQILRNMAGVRYKACLIYNSVYLELVPILRLLGISVIYSERVSASDISRNVHLQKNLRLCRYIFANSEYGRMILEGMTGKRIGFIRNGKPVVGQLAMIGHRKISRILVPCRIKAHKNQMLMLRYLADYPDFTGKIIFAGAAEDKDYEIRLKRFVDRNKLWERVEFLGYVQNMRDEYEKADLIALPSRLEGTANVVLEAYDYGRPVIVADIETERYIVKNPNLRFGIFETNEIKQCITYVEGLSDEEYKDLLEKNRQYVLKNYSISRMAENIYSILRQSGL